MAFFNLPSAKATSKRDQQLLKKMQNSQKSSTAVRLKGSTKLIDRIQSITSLVKSKFAGKEDELILITEEQQLIYYIDKCIDNDIISIDTETTGLDPILDNLVGICIYTPSLKAAYIPVNHISYITNEKCGNQLPVEFITEQFQRLVDSKTKTIWFNAPFDIRFLINHIHVTFEPYFDTSIASRCLNSNEPKGQKSLKALHKKYCWGNRGEALTFGKLFDDIPFNLVPINIAYLYAASDAIYTHELYEFQAQYLEPTGKYYESRHMQKLSNLFFNIEMKSMMTFISMEQTGFTIDYEYAKDLSIRYHELANKMQDNLNKVAEPYLPLIEDYRRTHMDCRLTDPINYESSIQLAVILYDILKIKPVDKKSPRGTGEEILKQIDHPLCNAILDNRRFTKVLSTYIDKLPKEASEYPDKRIHCRFNQYGADCITGNSYILTNDGYVPIQSLFDGNEYNGIFEPCFTTIYNKNFEEEESSEKIVYYGADTLKIHTDDYTEFEGTFNHPILVPSMQMYEVKHLIKNGNSNEIYDSFEFRKLDELEIGDVIAIPYEYNIFPNNYVKSYLELNTIYKDIRKIPEYITEEFAEFIGICHASCTVVDMNGYSVIGVVSKNESVTNRFKYLAKELFDIDCIIHTDVAKNEDGSDYNFTACSISTEFCNDLISYINVNVNSSYAQHGITKSPKSVIKSYIKGLTSDSTFDNHTQTLSMFMFDNQQMDFVRQALFNMGIITTGSTIDKSYLNDYYSYGEVIIYTVNISGAMYKKFLDEIGTIDSYEELDSYNDIDYVYDSKYFYTVITNIEQSRNTVYDLCIPNSHSFIANGIINHNTGRVSSDSPNLQNIPSRPFKLSDGTEIDSGHDVRQLFTATPGYILLSCDYSGQEVRVAAHVSNDKKMIQAYRDNKDVYSEIAAVAFNKEYEECCEKRPDGTDNPEGKARRGEAKKIVLGILYGRGIPSIAEQLGKTIQEAQNIYDKVLNKFDGLSKFIESAEDVARELGYTETVWGRRRQLPDIQLPYYEFKYKNGMSPNIDPLDLDISDDDIAKLTNEVPDDIIVDLTKKLLKCRGYKQREQLKEQIRANGFTIKDNTSNIAQAQRQIINGIVQGSSADLTKLAQIELYNNQELKELGFRMLIPVHDEIIAECPIENVKRCAELMSYCMVHAGSDLCVPLKCDVALFKSWYGKEIDINSL